MIWITRERTKIDQLSCSTGLRNYLNQVSSGARPLWDCCFVT